MNNVLVDREPKGKPDRKRNSQSSKGEKGKKNKDTSKENLINKYFNKKSTLRSIIIVIEMIIVMGLCMFAIGYSTLYFKSWLFFFLMSVTACAMLLMIVKIEFIFVFVLRLMCICFMLLFIYLGYQLTTMFPVDNIGRNLIITIATLLSLYIHVYFLSRENASNLF